MLATRKLLIFLVLSALLLTQFQIARAAVVTSVTVSSITIGNWQYGGTTAKLRVYASDTFDQSGNFVIGSSRGSGKWYKQVDCTVTGAVLSIPSFTLFVTTTSTLPDGSYTFVFVDYKGTERDVYLSEIKVPDTLGATVTFSQLYAYSTRTAARPRSTDVYSKDQVDALLTSLSPAPIASDSIKGIGRTSTAPADSTDPIFMAETDSRLGLARRSGHCTFDGDSITRGLNLTFGTEDWPSKIMSEPWFSISGCTKHNTAISGSVTTDIIARYAANDRPYSPSVTGLPGYFFLMIGINDVHASTSAATIYANITTIRNLALADGYTVYVCVPTPNGNDVQSLRLVQQDLANLLRSTGWPIIDFDKALPDPTNTTFYQDLLHWTAAGAAFAAKYGAAEITRNSPGAGAASELTYRTLSKIGSIGINGAPANHVPLDITHLHADVGTASFKITAQTDGDQVFQQMANGTGLAYVYLTNQVPNFDFQGSYGNALLLASNNELQLATGGEARFTLTSDGKLGIGAFGPVVSGLPQPDKLLHLRGSLNSLKLQATNAIDPVWAQAQNGSGIGLFGVEGSVAGSTYTDSLAYSAFYVSSAGSPAALQLGTSGTARMTILPAGTVGIGTNAPTVALDVVGAGKFTAGLTSTSTASNVPIVLATTATTNEKFIHVGNTSGDAYFGIQNSAGSFFNNAAAYEALIDVQNSATPAFNIITANTVGGKTRFSTTGVTVGGALDVTGAVKATTFLIQTEGAVLSISSNTITPTNAIHHVGAGLIKTITVPSGFVSGCIQLVPDSAFTYDATGNIVVAGGGGTATISRPMNACYSSSSSKWYMSY